MKTEKPKIPRFSDLSARAGKILARGETRLTLIEALAVMMVQMMLLVVLTQTAMTVEAGLGPVDSARYERWADLVILLWFAALFLVGLFLSVPLWIGFLQMAARAADGEEIVLAMLFEPFSSRRSYRRALGLEWMLLWRTLLLILVVGITGIIATGGGLVLLLIGIVLMIGEGILFGCLYARRFHVGAVVLRKGISIREAKRMTKKWRGLACDCRFELCLCPWLLLGLLTVGILTVWDTLPRMALVYFGYAEEMEKNMIQLEEDKHE